MSSPILILLPGMEGSGTLFAPLLMQLPASIDVQVIGYPTDSTAGYAALIAYVQQRLPQDRDYVLLGESFSGPIAIALAALGSPHLRGVILSSSFASKPQAKLPLYAALMSLVPSRFMTSRLAMRILLLPDANDAVCNMLQQAIRKLPRATMHMRLREIAAVDMNAQFAQINLPMLYLRASADVLVPASIATQLQQRRPEMQIVEIDGPHFLLQTQPAAAAKAIEDFLRNVQRTI